MRKMKDCWHQTSIAHHPATLKVLGKHAVLWHCLDVHCKHWKLSSTPKCVSALPPSLKTQKKREGMLAIWIRQGRGRKRIKKNKIKHKYKEINNVDLWRGGKRTSDIVWYVWNNARGLSVVERRMWRWAGGYRLHKKRKLRATACPAVPHQTVNEELDT